MLRRFQVSGHVQGVFFRASTRAVAQPLGITGYARNLANGDVEVLADGTEAALQQLHQWLHRGPEMARVDQVVELEVLPHHQETDGFKVL